MSEAESTDNRGCSNILIIALVALFVVVLGAILVFLIFRPGEEETPTPVPTTEPVASITAAPPVTGTDPVWDRIQASGKIKVGTSADYRPFEYYTDDLLLDGFDIALIRDIGEVLGLGVEISDMVFDGLGNALRVDQIDVAIAGISYTEERDAQVDFSNIYFVTNGAAIANENNPNAINTAEDLAPYRVGVQSGSVYDDFINDELVSTGKMPASSVHRYQRISDALPDLSNGMIDYVLADFQPAETAVETGAFKIAGEGVNKQLISIAMPQGAARLQSELNTALLQLQNTGRLADLAEQYMGLNPDEIEPVPTPDPSLPTATPPPAAGCIDSMLWVSDLSYDDQNMTNLPKLLPGEKFQKGWRVRNTGTCTWDNTYSLVPVDGNNPAAIMSGQPVQVQGTVAPGQTYDFWVDLVAPIQPGTYVQFWTMRNGNGILFGDRIWVAVEVIPNATPTPPPTQTPSPTIQFTADPSTINEGECSTLAWNTENVQAVYLYPQGEPWQNYGVPGTGTRTVCPSTTTTYELRVVKLDGTVEIRQTTVFVNPNPNAPNITRFTVEPPYPIEAGQCVHITWVVEGAVSNVSLARNNTVLWDPAPMSGSIQDCPPGTGQMVYTLVATGPGGTSQAQQFTNILETTPPPTATPAPPTTTPVTPIPTMPPEPTATLLPPVPEAPVIYNFTISPNQVKVGDFVHVTWTTGGGTDRVQVLQNGAIFNDNAPLQLTEDFQMSEIGDWTYELVATNSAGETTSVAQKLVVTEVEQENPIAGTSWNLLSYYNGQGDVPALEGTTVSAQFLDDGRLVGSSGCNSYDATYHVDGNTIAIVLGFSTQILCEDAIMQQENTYLALLERAVTYQLTDTQLLISDANGVVILTFTNLIAVPLS